MPALTIHTDIPGCVTLKLSVLRTRQLIGVVLKYFQKTNITNQWSEKQAEINVYIKYYGIALIPRERLSVNREISSETH